VTDAKPPGGCGAKDDQSKTDLLRRGLLQAATVALLPRGVHAEDDDPNAKLRPQVGDLLVRSDGDQKGEVITAADLKVGNPPIFAWAMDPGSKVVRDGSRLNQVLLLRLDPATLGPETQPHAADGMIAFSAVCTHQQCPVTGWFAERQVLHCPCHQSEYDPRQNAKVVAGPAPRPLAALPLKVADGKPQVAAAFIGRVGMAPQTM
jgi:rieske iron-sulfur protein